MIEARVYKDHVLTEDSDKARDLYAKSHYGRIVRKRVSLSLFEALYLAEKEKIALVDGRGSSLSFDKFYDRVNRSFKQLRLWYFVFRDLRSKGYLVQSGVKFGAAFRVYDKGHKPGKEHAKWVVSPISETEKLPMTDLASYARVSHSTRKHLLLAVVDSEDAVTYYDVSWIRP